MWSIAVELCDRSRHIIDMAGTANDKAARLRVLSGSRHLNRSVVLGQFIPSLQEEIDARFAPRTRRARTRLNGVHSGVKNKRNQ